MVETVELVNRAMSVDLANLKMISHNLSNVHTNGFKRMVGVVSQQFNTTFVGQMNTEPYIDWSAGSMQATHSSADLAINGDGYFLVEKNGTQLVTRKGQTQIDGQGVLRLITGEKLYGQSGEIVLDPLPFEVDQVGNIYQQGQIKDKLQLVKVNSSQLQHYNNGLYKALAVTSLADDERQIQQGFIESANVSSMTEMVGLMQLSRHFESMAEVAKSYHQIMGQAVQQLGEF
ncbi:flagellar hook-basal body protein [Spartinivicinus ruber]|uniref:flagellar hook-basal body protein n=1 Tax=Spartinivicinus ruber TaxID=2683272 RepID=UPI0013D0B32D|nr:flagellar hook basal-body protein [Spartinivicinus ruber]